MNQSKYENEIKKDNLEREAQIKISYLDNIASEMKNGCLTIFAGAGLSVPSGYVDWKRLLKPMSEQLGLNINMDLTVIAQYYENEFGRNELNCAILNEFAKVPLKNDNMEILATFPVTNFWTTNYDSLIEDTLRSKGRNVDVITEEVQYKYHRPNRDAVVYKMHGDKSVPDKAVITKNDYEIYDKTRGVFTKSLILELITNTVLFIGFGFSDPNLDRIISLVRHTLEDYAPKNHYCFMRSVGYKSYLDKDGQLTAAKKKQYEQDKQQQELRIRDMRRYGIQTILVDEFEQITTMLHYIRVKYTLDKVFISGGLNPLDNTQKYGDVFDKREDNDKFSRGERFVMSLSKRLIDEGYDIVSGFGVGIGNYVVSGAFMSSKYSNRGHIADHIHIQPIISVEEQTKDMKQNIREKLIDDCGTVVTLFGKTSFEKSDNRYRDALLNDGTYIEYQIAKEKDKIVIPVGITGFTSKYIYTEEKKNPRYKKNDKMKNLGDKKLNNEQLIDNIIKLIEEQKNLKVQEMKSLLVKNLFIDFDDAVNVFLSFHYKSAKKQAKIISDIINETEGMQVAKEFEKVTAIETKKWIDSKIANTKVTILLLNEQVSTSEWVKYEIDSSIKNGNAFVIIELAGNNSAENILKNFCVGQKNIVDLYGIHKMQQYDTPNDFRHIPKWVKEALKKTM